MPYKILCCIKSEGDFKITGIPDKTFYLEDDNNQEIIFESYNDAVKIQSELENKDSKIIYTVVNTNDRGI